MGKEAKIPKIHKDPYARASYLFQVANFHASQGNLPIARMMARNVDLVAKRTVLRLSPHLKRRMCKWCNEVLIPGLTMSICIENVSRSSSKADVLVHTCLACTKSKRYPVGKNPSYILKCDENKVEIP